MHSIINYEMKKKSKTLYGNTDLTSKIVVRFPKPTLINF